MDICSVTPQSLLIVIRRVTGGMAVLLQMRGGQIQFLQGFHVLWRFQRLGWLGGASVLSGIFCTPPVSSVLGPVELDPAGDSGACQPRKGVELSGVALVGSFFNEKRAFFGGIDFIGGDNAGRLPIFLLVIFVTYV